MTDAGGEAPVFLYKGWWRSTSFSRIIPDDVLLSNLVAVCLVEGVNWVGSSFDADVQPARNIF